MASGVESGSMEVVGYEERPISTTGVIVTSPSWIAGAVVVMSDTLYQSSGGDDSVVEVERRSDSLHGVLSDTARDSAATAQGFGDDLGSGLEMTAALTDRRDQLLDHGDEAPLHRNVADRSIDVPRLHVTHLIRVRVER